MWLNAAYVHNEFMSYSYADHFQFQTTAFFPRSAVHSYLQGYTEINQLDHYITGSTDVIDLSYNDSTKKFSVTTTPTLDASTTTSYKTPQFVQTAITVEEFDYVAIATGLFNVP